ncbi:hypothetical protein DCO58_05165 [Helicobacter saguini]|uniref:Pyridoxamine 5'-phosphate oxidase N-terminal domain-containing protein n=1 Tax=Helicobacter saguini TaxID=1548018 RepID=A0A347VT30_9HELI|nr:pyridoxamine 5'-phosphate oxidase family protein [Helicobacter saguini]MWV62260.1 hypothetical protein [Helicobacter saguini]MWV67067.1 hypothetical protein [Helicobacter saguini]MWV69417.1 hypothetical protein [Helicobacter saguini]MWV71029.1 hypothetical protein [Helicobacter saguini]TLD95065.1 hypothetical protein LS64_003925 [Helicobacter saguini]
MEKLQEIMSFLESNRIQIFSTSVDNKPVSRPIGSAALCNGRIWYCMNNDKPMFKQLQDNPNVCICVCGSDFSWIRIYARVVFSDDKLIKNMYMQRPNSSFKSVDDPRFSVFYLSEIRAEIHIKGETKVIEID